MSSKVKSPTAASPTAELRRKYPKFIHHHDELTNDLKTILLEGSNSEQLEVVLFNLFRAIAVWEGAASTLVPINANKVGYKSAAARRALLDLLSDPRHPKGTSEFGYSQLHGVRQFLDLVLEQYRDTVRDEDPPNCAPGWSPIKVTW